MADKPVSRRSRCELFCASLWVPDITSRICGHCLRKRRHRVQEMNSQALRPGRQPSAPLRK